MFFTLVSLTGHGKETPQQPLHTQYRPMLFPASIPGHTEEEALDRLLVLNCLVFKLGIYFGSYFRYFIKFCGSYIVFHLTYVNLHIFNNSCSWFDKISTHSKSAENNNYS